MPGGCCFSRERFTEEARSIEPTIGAIRELKKIFGNTISTTLYRFVETTGIELPIVGMIHGTPSRVATIRPTSTLRILASTLFSRQPLRDTSEEHRNLICFLL